MQKWTQGDLRCWKTINKKKRGVNNINNQGQKWYKMLENGYMTDFAEQIDQRLVRLSLELNVIETN